MAQTARFWVPLCLSARAVTALHVAFIAPPASHYVPMLPIAHQLLEEGHAVTFVGLEETMAKIGRLVPLAKTRALEGQGPPKRSKAMMEFIQSVPYGASQLFTNFVIPMLGNLLAGSMLAPAKEAIADLKPDVLCVSFVYPPLYALSETLDIPVVGIGWATPGFLTVQNDMPWSLEPNFGSIHSRQDIHSDVTKLLSNLAVRLFSFFTLRLGSLVNTVNRFRIGHPRPLEPWEFDCVLQNPMVAMTLPELTSGSPNLLGPYTFMVGILDHPGLGGNSIAKSDDADRIMAWLDERQAANEQVLYVAFGSEVMINEGIMKLLVGAFKGRAFHVLWATKVKPTIPVPDSVFVTSFAPQRAVLSHRSVFGFLSHGGANSVNEALMMGKPMAIMPFFGDQMAVAVAQQELGVGLLVRKDTDAADLAKVLDRLANEGSFAERSFQVKQLNEQRRDMSRAVQVIVNHGSRAFPLHIPAPPAIWMRALPLVLSLVLFALCCTGCCCIRVQLQCPRCCRGKAASKTKAKDD